MTKKKFFGGFSIILIVAIFTYAAYNIFSKLKKSDDNEQTQVIEFINNLNKNLLRDSSCLDYGYISFDNRDEVLVEGELDVSSITYKTPVLGYIYVEDISKTNENLSNFSESIIYLEKTESIKQITNYVFYFEDSEVSGARYATNYTYNETDDMSKPYNISYQVKYDERFIKNANYLNNIVNVKDYYDESLKEEGKEYNWTTSIAKACEDINKTGGLLYFPCDTYIVNVSEDDLDVLFLQSQNEIVVDFCKSKLKMEANNLGQYRIVMARKCDKVTIKNGILQGDRMLHDYGDPGTGQFRDTHEGGHGVNVRGATIANIYNMEIYDFPGDAVCFSNTTGMEKNAEGKMVYVGIPTTVNIDKCILHHCRRQGVSVLDCKSFSITDSEIHSIGQFTWAYEDDCVDSSLKDVIIKGTAPSAGIDFEPDRYTFLVENAVVDTCYIHNTDNFAMVNTTVAQEVKDKGYLTTCPNLVVKNSLTSSCPVLSGENVDENGIFRQAVVENSTIVYDRLLSWSGYDDNGNLKENGAFAFTRLKFNNCRLVKTYTGHMSIWIEGSEFNNCVFEHNKNTLDNTVGFQNGLFSFSNTKLINNTFNNLIGNGKNGSMYSDHGITFFTNEDHGITVAEGSKGNVFYNSSIFLRRELSIVNDDADYGKTTFYKCKLYAYPNNVESAKFKNVTFQDCETRSGDGAQLVFENCKFLNSGAFYYYKRKFINCYIEMDDLEEKICYTAENGNQYGYTPFGGHAYGDSKSPYLYNTTIVINGDISHTTYDIRAFRNAYYYDECLIIIDRKYKNKKVLLKEHTDMSVTIEYA